MTDAEQLALAQHVLASQAQGLVVLLWQQPAAAQLTVPRAWVEQWVAQARQALCHLRQHRAAGAYEEL